MQYIGDMETVHFHVIVQWHILFHTCAILADGHCSSFSHWGGGGGGGGGCLNTGQYKAMR